MAIDPSLITTVQVKELPPLPISLTDNFPHEVGDVLSRATIQQLVDFVRAQSASYPYETKILTLPQASSNTYINANFDMTPGSTQGIGKVDGFWNGWAIHNGNNGTENLDGQTLIGYGANYSTIGQSVGEKEVALTADEIPDSGLSGTYTFTGSTDDNSQVGDFICTSDGQSYSPVKNINIPITGGGQAHNNMQPSFVVLFIMKLP